MYSKPFENVDEDFLTADEKQLILDHRNKLDDDIKDYQERMSILLQG